MKKVLIVIVVIALIALSIDIIYKMMYNDDMVPKTAGIPAMSPNTQGITNGQAVGER